MTPEQKARVNIDTLLKQAGWHVCPMTDANIHAARGVALREFPLNPGYGFADYGFEDAQGISPTEREFDRATTLGKPG